MSLLPRGWAKVATAGLLSAVALARVVLLSVSDGIVGGPRGARLALEVARLQAEVASLRCEVRLKDARLARVRPHKRPHFEAAERLEILTLRAACGWTIVETARRFLVTPATIASWFRRRDERGESAPLRARAPVNKFPDQVREVVVAMRATFPVLGTKRIADALARLGLHVAETTVRRMLKAPRRTGGPAVRGAPAAAPVVNAAVNAAGHEGRAARVTGRSVHDVWHSDFSFVPNWLGGWLPWGAFALPQLWPFGWWVGAVVDHHSRAVLATAHWKAQPTTTDALVMLEQAVKAAARAPRHLITDRGGQFQGRYRAWCAKHEIRPRFGAVHRHGSIAVIERFWGSLKRECLRRVVAPGLGSSVMFGAELGAYVAWYNAHRPHQGLGGRTPQEVLRGEKPAREKRRIETRAAMPLSCGSGGGVPPPGGKPRRVTGLSLVVDEKVGSAGLPVFRLKLAA